MAGIGQSMQTWEVALYGLFTILVMGIIQFFVNSYFQKAEKLKSEKVDNLIAKLDKLDSKLELIFLKINAHDTTLEVLKRDLEHIEKKIDEIENRLLNFEKGNR